MPEQVIGAQREATRVNLTVLPELIPHLLNCLFNIDVVGKVARLKTHLVNFLVKFFAYCGRRCRVDD